MGSPCGFAEPYTKKTSRVKFFYFSSLFCFKTLDKGVKFLYIYYIGSGRATNQKESDMMKLVEKGRCGDYGFGYVEQQGQRNQWVVIFPNGDLYSAPQNNLSSASSEAQYLNEFGA